VKDALAVLRFAENPRDRVAGFRVAQLLPGVGPKIAEAIVAAAVADDGFAAMASLVLPPRADAGFAAFAALHAPPGRARRALARRARGRGRLAYAQA
jgi:DNA helicase-2/ATP-dependent DNA helicase PcrA